MHFDDDDIDPDDLFSDSNESDNDGEEWKLKELKGSAARLKKLAQQILRTTEAIVETLPENEQEHISFYREWMMENAFKLLPKISGAMATLDYILMMENATVIKLAARELTTQATGLEMFGYKNNEYLDALRQEVEEFRKEFVNWVRNFPKEEPLWPDGWGLFYTEEDVQRWNSLNPDEQQEE